jgi:hypothetical protein
VGEPHLARSIQVAAFASILFATLLTIGGM